MLLPHLLGMLLIVGASLGADNRFFTSISSDAFDTPFDQLNDDAFDDLVLGKSFFRVPWIEAPSVTTARDGLGPLFNANTCTSCHLRNGSGIAYEAGTKDFKRIYYPKRSLITKLSVPFNGSKQHQQLIDQNGLVPEPSYGAQIAFNGIFEVPFEARSFTTFVPVIERYPDGTEVVLSKPTYGLDRLNYGALAPKTIITQRNAPALVGQGFLEAIPQAAILSNADPDDKNKDGISGRPNWINGRLGRFTWKASVPSLLEQTATAAAHDMGLTSPFFPSELCQESQVACKKAPRGRYDFDITAKRLKAIAFYLSSLKVPLPRVDEMHLKGKRYFEAINCNACHVDAFTTQDGTKIAPYSDLLLHDMGEGLADGRSEFQATGQEWRTPPLWGIGLYSKVLKRPARYLHDARAATLEEAILWHGGEAQSSKDAFKKLSAKKRDAIIYFLKGL